MARRWAPQADKSAVCAINRHLRRAGTYPACLYVVLVPSMGSPGRYIGGVRDKSAPTEGWCWSLKFIIGTYGGSVYSSNEFSGRGGGRRGTGEDWIMVVVVEP